MPGTCIYNSPGILYIQQSGVKTTFSPFRSEASIYKFLKQIVNTRSMALLILGGLLSACQAPERTIVREQLEQQSDSMTVTRSKSGDDTTTIRHTVINDTTYETKIIRRYHEKSQDLAQSLHKEHSQDLSQEKDTLTPKLLDKVLKGVKYACIAAFVFASVFLFGFLAILVYLVKGR